MIPIADFFAAELLDAAQLGWVWQRFDDNRDGKLDADEIARLVAHIRTASHGSARFWPPPATEAEKATASPSPPAPRCERSHTMERRTSTPLGYVGVSSPICDGCRRERLASSCPHFFHCPTCRYDLCPDCAASEMPAVHAPPAPSAAAAAQIPVVPAAIAALLPTKITIPEHEHELTLTKEMAFTCALCKCDQPGPLVNDEGSRVALATYRGKQLHYCGRHLGREAIPGSDGQCGPDNGPQCASCKRLTAAPPLNNVFQSAAGDVHVCCDCVTAGMAKMAHGGGRMPESTITRADVLRGLHKSNSAPGVGALFDLSGEREELPLEVADKDGTNLDTWLRMVRRAVAALGCASTAVSIRCYATDALLGLWRLGSFETPPPRRCLEAALADIVPQLLPLITSGLTDLRWVSVHSMTPPSGQQTPQQQLCGAMANLASAVLRAYAGHIFAEGRPDELQPEFVMRRALDELEAHGSNSYGGDNGHGYAATTSMLSLITTAVSTGADACALHLDCALSALAKIVAALPAGVVANGRGTRTHMYDLPLAVAEVLSRQSNGTAEASDAAAEPGIQTMLAPPLLCIECLDHDVNVGGMYKRELFERNGAPCYTRTRSDSSVDWESPGCLYYQPNHLIPGTGHWRLCQDGSGDSCTGFNFSQSVREDASLRAGPPLGDWSEARSQQSSFAPQRKYGGLKLSRREDGLQLLCDRDAEHVRAVVCEAFKLFASACDPALMDGFEALDMRFRVLQPHLPFLAQLFQHLLWWMHSVEGWHIIVPLFTAAMHAAAALMRLLDRRSHLASVSFAARDEALCMWTLFRVLKGLCLYDIPVAKAPIRPSTEHEASSGSCSGLPDVRQVVTLMYEQHLQWAIAMLRSHHADLKQLAQGALGGLAKRVPRVAVPLLLALMGDAEDAEGREVARKAMCKLPLDAAILASDCIKLTVQVLRDGDASTRKEAASALQNWAMQDAANEAILDCGGIDALVDLLHHGEVTQRRTALNALGNVLYGGEADSYAAKLAWKSRLHEHKDALLNARGLLLEILQTGSSAEKEYAAYALFPLFTWDVYEDEATQAAVIAPLVTLLSEGDLDARDEAANLLPGVVSKLTQKASFLQPDECEALLLKVVLPIGRLTTKLDRRELAVLGKVMDALAIVGEHSDVCKHRIVSTLDRRAQNVWSQAAATPKRAFAAVVLQALLGEQQEESAVTDVLMTDAPLSLGSTAVSMYRNLLYGHSGLAMHACAALRNLIGALVEKDDQAVATSTKSAAQNALSPLFSQLTSALIHRATRGPDRITATPPCLRAEIYRTLAVAIECATTDDLDEVEELLACLLTHLKELSTELAATPDVHDGDEPAQSPKKRRRTSPAQEDEEVGGAAAIVQVIDSLNECLGQAVEKVGERIRSARLAEIGEVLLAVVTGATTNQPDCLRHHTQAFHALGIVASMAGVAFNSHMEQLMPVIIRALSQEDAPDLWNYVLRMLADGCSAIGQLVSPHLTSIVGAVEGLHPRTSTNLKVRAAVLECLADLTLAAGGSIIPHIPSLMPILVDAVSMYTSTHGTVHSQEGTSAAIASGRATGGHHLQLRALGDAALGLYSCMLQELREARAGEAFVPHLDRLLSLILGVADDHTASPDACEELIVNAAGVICDVAETLQARFWEAARQPPYREPFSKLLTAVAQSPPSEASSERVRAIAERAKSDLRTLQE